MVFLLAANRLLLASGAVGLLLAVLLVQGPPGSEAYLRLMGGLESMCQGQGAHCWSDAICCQGLKCQRNWWQYKRSISGVCQSPSAEIPGEEWSARVSSYNAAPSWSQCRTDWDCPRGQCCHTSLASGRGIRRRICSRTICPGDDEDAETDRTDDQYENYYPRRFGR
ncbi:hypothetical protein BOX15_Mlig031025g2 [Macrostomum lignano]|uniref:WAP domain-containing protein n=1 Tax=Macrostomum lignano TaxID=282301 RepID=A0A267DAT1_9PLAT|nr:hypothetical protein BOX15_Mlig031025g2 [Macrostomum lignano]